MSTGTESEMLLSHLQSQNGIWGWRAPRVEDEIPNKQTKGQGSHLASLKLFTWHEVVRSISYFCECWSKKHIFTWMDKIWVKLVKQSKCFKLYYYLTYSIFIRSGLFQIKIWPFFLGFLEQFLFLTLAFSSLLYIFESAYVLICPLKWFCIWLPWKKAAARFEAAEDGVSSLVRRSHLLFASTTNSPLGDRL